MIATKLQVCFLAPEEVLAREGEKVDKLWFMGKGPTVERHEHHKRSQKTHQFDHVMIAEGKILCDLEVKNDIEMVKDP